MSAEWRAGWLCDPAARYAYGLEATAQVDIVRVGDPDVAPEEKAEMLCEWIRLHRVPVLSKNVACVTRESICFIPDTRGWGNDDAVADSLQVSPGECAEECVRREGCRFWTYDPSGMYGHTMCWTWTGEGPEKVREQRGWISGNASCTDDYSDGDGETVVRWSASEPGITPGLLRLWSMRDLPDGPGRSHALRQSGNGRCLQGFCECFPPYRGYYCELVDQSPQDRERAFTGVLHYLTSDFDDDIRDMVHSLPRLWKRYNSRVDYPVVVFHDGLSQAHREEIVEASPNRIWFAYVDDYLDVPDWLDQRPDNKARLGEVKWTMGYRGMCRFRSGPIFTHPAIAKNDYAMTLDTDGYFPADVEGDPMTEMHEGNYDYTYSHMLADQPGAVRHFWHYTLLYMGLKGVHPRGTDLLKNVIRQEDAEWNYMLYMNDIEIVRLSWFTSDPYQDYFRYLDSVGGFWLYRWGDHAMRTIAVGMWMNESKILNMDVPYGHQAYCKCPEYAACVREGVQGGTPADWWACVNVTGAESA
jgi:hypothetical protein